MYIMHPVKRAHGENKRPIQAALNKGDEPCASAVSQGLNLPQIARGSTAAWGV